MKNYAGLGMAIAVPVGAVVGILFHRFSVGISMGVGLEAVCNFVVTWLTKTSNS
jgi:hypothetical protein